jgi:hypothetical protein
MMIACGRGLVLRKLRIGLIQGEWVIVKNSFLNSRNFFTYMIEK